VTTIPGQYHALNGTDTITTLLMDGGGNDILYQMNCDGEENEAACKAKADEAAAIFEDLYKQIHADGVPHVIQMVRQGLRA
jgi:hypothetical protein